MNNKTRKILLLSVKLLIAAGLLAWVLGKVHWRDYALGRADGESYVVLEELREGPGPARFRVAGGVLGAGGEQVRPESDFVPVPATGRVIRAGFATSLRRIDGGLAGLGAMGFGVSLLIVAVRWRMLLAIQEVHIPLWEAVRLTFLGQFFNAIVPGTVGGDLVKAYYVARHTPKKAAVLVSVFADRLLGLVEMALMASGMLSMIFLLGLAEDPEALWLPAVCVGAVLLVVAAALAFLLSRRFRGVFRLEKIYRRLPISHHIAAAGDAAALYRRRLGSLVKAVLITFVSHLAFVGFVCLIGKSLALQTPWYSYFVFVPLIYIIGAVPLTPGGVGWVENWYLEFFQSPQCGASQILVLALLARLIPILWGLPGAVVAVTGARLPKVDSIQAELGYDEESAE